MVLQKNVGLDLRGPVKNPLERNVINAVNGKLENGAGQVSLLVDPSCRNLISALQKQRLSPGGDPSPMEANEHHFARALGWLVHYLYPVRRDVKNSARVANG